MKRKSGEMDHIAFIDELADNKRQKEENGEMGEATDGNSNNSSAPKKRVNQSPHWFLTWNNYTIGEMETLIKEFDRLCYTYVFQEEIGKKSGIPHLQGCFSFHKPCRWSEFGFGKGPHWERVGTAKKGKFASRKTGLTNAREYCCKEDTRKPGTFPYTKNYDLKEEMEGMITEDMLKPWQHDIIKIIKERKRNGRDIFWYYSKKGGTGKSSFAKYLFNKIPKVWVTGGNSYKHMLQSMVMSPIKQKENGWTIIIDLAMKTKGKISWQGLEDIKKGFIATEMYETKILQLGNPHIIVFANHLPQIIQDGEENIDYKRFQITEITDVIE